MIRESLYFTYDGKPSYEFGILNVAIGNGLYEESLVANRSIIEERVRGRKKPHFFGINEDPLEIPVSFAFTDKYDEQKIRQVVRWLFQSYYKPLVFSSNPNRIFYCTPVDDSTLVHNGLRQGYITLKFRCDSPYSYSSFITSSVFNIASEQIIEVDCNTDEDIYPNIYFKKLSAGEFSITNLSDSGREFKFKDLLSNETIHVDCENEEIETDVSNRYIWNNFNNQFLKLVYGKNRLLVKGDCENLYFKFQNILRQG
ncbi:phage tail protein [Bacillus infantis]|uniref:distal tail protein Dit n=1 Tax=Bacillus infantis TaxID=324767 RepID=UPI00101D40B3|nr:distal tail protein Dit [Bacillus infantis]RYI30622.1 phage tail protein [Bacillus infantis]